MVTVPETTVTLEQMAEHLSVTVPAKVQHIYEEAVELVAAVFSEAWRDVSVKSVDNCVRRVGRALRDAEKKASTGAGQTGVNDVPQIRVPADPLTSSYPIIRHYVVMGL